MLNLPPMPEPRSCCPFRETMAAKALHSSAHNDAYLHMTDVRLSPPARLIVIGAATVIVLAGIQAAQPILSPFLVAVFFAMLTAPAMAWLVRRGAPPVLAATAVVSGLIAILAVGLIFLGMVLTQLIDALPLYQEQTEAALTAIASTLAEYGIDINSIRLEDLVSRTVLIQQATGLLRQVSTAGFDLVLVIIAILFLLLEMPRMSSGLQRRLGADNLLLQNLRQSSRILIDYVVVRTKVNLTTGVGVGVFLGILGIDFAVLWGLLAFVLSYIPYIGLLLAALPPVLLALFKFGPAGAVAVVLAIAVIDTAAENLLFPQMAGKGLNLSPVVVLFSVVFWGWILGTVGVFLAVPLTIAVKLFLESWEETRWLGYLMSAGNGDREAPQGQNGGDGL
jgi:AI-2 transport protein TqsA